MSTYLQCETQAKIVGQKFHELLKGKGELQQKFFLEYPDLKLYNIQSSILVLGLNPSGEDDPLVGRAMPNLFSYIPQNLEILNQVTTNEQEMLQSFCYSKYFKTFVEAFQQLQPAYNPIWFNKDVLNNICNNNSKHLTKELTNYLNQYTEHDTGHYLVFTDLIQYSKTNSKQIIQFIEDKHVVELVNQYLRLILDFIKPKAVLVANAAVSHYLVKHFYNNEPTTHFNLCGTEVFLGSMLTGQRAMDVYSRQRLFNEVQFFLNEQG